MNPLICPAAIALIFHACSFLNCPGALAQAEREPGSSKIKHQVVRVKSAGRHSEPELKALTFSSDSAFLAVSPESEKVQFIDVSSGEVIGRIPDYFGSVISMNFSRDGQRVFVIGTEHQKLFDVASGKEVAVEPVQDRGDLGLDLEYRNGKWLVLELTPQGALARDGTFKEGDELTGIGQGKSGPIQSVVGKKASAIPRLLKGPAETFVQLEFIPAGSTKRHKTIVQRDGSAQLETSNLPDSAGRFEENKAWCIQGDYHAFFNAATGQRVRSLRTEQIGNRTGNPAISPNANRFAFFGKTLAEEPEYAIEVFDIRLRKRLAFIENFKSHVPSGSVWRSTSFHDLKFTPDNDSLLLACWDRVCEFSVRSGELKKVFNVNPTLDEAKDRIRIVGGPTGGSLMEQATLSESGDVDPREPHMLRQIETFDLSSSGLLAVGRWGVVKVFNYETGDLVHSFTGLPEEESIEHIQFTPDGQHLVFYVHGELHLCDMSSITKR